MANPRHQQAYGLKSPVTHFCVHLLHNRFSSFFCHHRHFAGAQGAVLYAITVTVASEDGETETTVVRPRRYIAYVSRAHTYQYMHMIMQFTQ
jgi:hypothetical protein